MTEEQERDPELRHYLRGAGDLRGAGHLRGADDLRDADDVSREYRRLESAPLPGQEIDARILAASKAALQDASASSGAPASSGPPASAGAPASTGAPDSRVDDRHRTSRTAAPSRRRPPWFAPFALAASVILSVALVLAVIMGPMKQRRSDETAAHWVYASAHRADQLRLQAEAPMAPRRLDAERPHDARSWLDRIHELRREGRYLEAEAEYRRFRAAFPDAAVDEDDAPR